MSCYKCLLWLHFRMSPVYSAPFRMYKKTHQLVSGTATAACSILMHCKWVDETGASVLQKARLFYLNDFLPIITWCIFRDSGKMVTRETDMAKDRAVGVTICVSLPAHCSSSKAAQVYVPAPHYRVLQSDWKFFSSKISPVSPLIILFPLFPLWFLFYLKIILFSNHLCYTSLKSR